MPERKFKFRERTETDDIDAIIHQSVARYEGDTFTLPTPRTAPLAVWLTPPAQKPEVTTAATPATTPAATPAVTAKATPAATPTDTHVDTNMPVGQPAGPEASANATSATSATSASSTGRSSYMDSEIRKLLNWPLSTAAACHNCAHEFDGVPVPLPVRYDEFRKVYFCRGIFCSWQCAKRYNMDTTHGRSGTRNMFIANLAFATWIKLKGPIGETKMNRMQRYLDSGGIQPAQPKEVLIRFGGNVSIDDYRKGFYSVTFPDDVLNAEFNGKYIRDVRDNTKILLPFAREDDSVHNRTDSENTGGSGASGFSAAPIVGVKRCGVPRIEMGSWKDALSRVLADDKKPSAPLGNVEVRLARKRPLRTKDTLLTSMGIKISKKPKT
jgi:hypothetical protein